MGNIYCHELDRDIDLDFNVEHLDECWRCQMETMVMTPEKLERFKRVYQANKTAKSFEFDGHEFVPEYAKYMIEYLEAQYARGS